MGFSEVTKWLSGNKEWIGAIAALAGIIAGPILTQMKGLVDYLHERSIDRSIEKNLSLIGQYTKSLSETARVDGVVHSQYLKAYEETLRERLQKALDDLRDSREVLMARERTKLSEPQGIRSGLLIFAPNGFVGWVLHSLFYFLLLVFLFLEVMSVGVLLDGKDSIWERVLTASEKGFFSLFYVAMAQLPRAISLKRRKLAQFKRRPKLNEDLPWWRRGLLLFKNDDAATDLDDLVKDFEKICFYMLLALGLLVLFIYRMPSSDDTNELLSTGLRLFLAGLCFLGAWLFWYDSILSRGLNRIQRNE